jgi:RHS repeat-associated protein
MSPKTITFDAPNTNIAWLYDAAGVKLRKTSTGSAEVEIHEDTDGIPTGTYEAQTIYSQGRVAAGSTVTFQASQAIVLEEGFTVELGATFSALMILPAASTRTQDYVGGLEYKNGTLEAIYHPEGRATPKAGGAYQYEYTLKDQLGNARLTFSDLNADGTVADPEILQENQYYPFGMEAEQPNADQIGRKNLYQYNGKELNGDFGLGWSDYGARWYDASLGRWWSVDEMGEKYQEWSGYNYVMGNPVRFIDPDGQKVDDIILRGENNSSVTLKTDLIDVSADVSSLGIDFGGEYTLEGEDVLSAGLDLVGIVDPTGIADGLNAALQAKNGDVGGAVISAIGLVPYVGDVAKVGKVGKDIKVIENAIEAVKTGDNAKGVSKGTDYVVTPKGETIKIPDGAKGPTNPEKGSGMVYQGGSGGNGMDKRTTGVRIMDANSNQGKRVNYMNKDGQTVDPKTGRTISNKDTRGHLPLQD